jgi:hypothetical protein
MNHATITASVPVPAKLLQQVNYQFLILRSPGEFPSAYKKPVLTPQLDTGALLIISGVQKLNIMAIPFEEASAHPAVFARKRC